MATFKVKGGIKLKVENSPPNDPKAPPIAEYLAVPLKFCVEYLNASISFCAFAVIVLIAIAIPKNLFIILSSWVHTSFTSSSR